MINVREAQKTVLNNTSVNEKIIAPLEKASGKVLAEPIYAPVNMPSFPQSAMDGYAIRHEDLIPESNHPLKIKGEIKAGDQPDFEVNKGETARIFTGAQVPKGADTVIMQEYVEANGSTIVPLSNGIKKGINIRAVGDQITTGMKALEKGTLLTPGAIGFLASMGVTDIPVIKDPKIGIVVTGNEITSPWDKLEPGSVYECNSFSLKAALKSLGLHDVIKTTVKDDPKETYAIISAFLKKVDILLITGGISVGKYDLVKEVLEKLGIEELFHNVAQKPGKPLYAGKNPEGMIVFGLPGNPGAVLSCFYEYVYPVIRKQQGFKHPYLQTESRKLEGSVKKKEGRSYFFKGKLKPEKEVIPLTGQESFMLKAFAEADCLIFIPENLKGDLLNEWVEVHKLPANC